MSGYVIAPSPLVKIFLKEWHDRLMEDPTLIQDSDTAFEFDVTHGVGAVKFKFNVPKQIDDPVLFNWLIGGAGGATSRETDTYGLVKFDPKVDVVSAFHEMAMLQDFASEDPKKMEEARKRLVAKSKEAAAQVTETRKRILALSEARIKRAIRLNHNNLVKQWQVNVENNLGKYPPSIAELLGSQAIVTEIEASKAKGAEIKKRASELMNNPVI